MPIRAVYETICPRCHQTIVPGTKILWSKKVKARHTVCPGAPRSYQITDPKYMEYHCGVPKPDTRGSIDG